FYHFGFPSAAAFSYIGTDWYLNWRYVFICLNEQARTTSCRRIICHTCDVFGVVSLFVFRRIYLGLDFNRLWFVKLRRDDGHSFRAQSGRATSLGIESVSASFWYSL